MLKNIISELAAWLAAIVFAMPGKLGQAARYAWCRRSFKMWGQGSRMGRGTVVMAADAIIVGTNCNLGQNCFLSAEGGAITVGDSVNFNANVTLNASVEGHIRIGNNCLIGPNVVFRTASHNFEDRDRLIGDQGHASGDITIEDDVWISANAVILPGVTIGRGAVIGAGAVVTRSIDAMSINVGIPARKIRMRGERT